MLKGAAFSKMLPLCYPMLPHFWGIFLSLHEIIADNAVIFYLPPMQFLDGDTEVLQGGNVLGFQMF
jgi:hypothetical protein